MPATTISNLPPQLNFSIYAGTTFSLQLTWEISGSPVNLTGYSAAMNIVNQQTGATILSLTSTNGDISLGGSAGTITLNLTATQTGSLTTSSCLYDLLLTSGSGAVTALVAGYINIVEGQTSP